MRLRVRSVLLAPVLCAAIAVANSWAAPITDREAGRLDAQPALSISSPISSSSSNPPGPGAIHIIDSGVGDCCDLVQASSGFVIFEGADASAPSLLAMEAFEDWRPAWSREGSHLPTFRANEAPRSIETPEPGTGMMLLLGLVVLAAMRRFGWTALGVPRRADS
jgi:hypothetical protein